MYVGVLCLSLLSGVSRLHVMFVVLGHLQVQAKGICVASLYQHLALWVSEELSSFSSLSLPSAMC